MKYGYDDSIHFLLARWLENVFCCRHLHYRFEMVLVKRGVLSMSLYGKELTVRAGEAVLIPPYALHNFTIKTDHLICILEYPPDYTQAFLDFLKNRQPENAVVKLPQPLLDYLWTMLPAEDVDFCQIPILKAQAILSPLCHVFAEQCTFLETEDQHPDIFIKALHLVSRNFQKPLSLESVADQVGVRRETLTRMFQRQTGYTFWEYVLTLRTMFAITLLRRGKSVSEAAYGSGFSSIRTFNRVFRTKTGMSPTEYLQSGTFDAADLFVPDIPAWEGLDLDLET